jgi:Icc-related predicted phosphoesterase
MRVVCLSDTHTQGRALVVPDGDVLVHCGDWTYRGERSEILKEMDWFAGLPHRYKVCIAGNHDFGLEDADFVSLVRWRYPFHYLHDSGIEIDGLRFWGSPVQPWFHNWAFNMQRGEELRRHWAQVPEGTDVLVTHGPAFGFGDRVPSGEMVGDVDLLDRIFEVRPQLHLCGHIHRGYGQYFFGGVHFVNCSSLSEMYLPINQPIVVDL